jgi:transposase
MSLKPSPLQPVPDETARVAHAAFPKGNVYLKLRDQLGTIFTDADFATLFPKDGQPSLPPWRLALITILQFRENLSDRHAAEAVRSRIDWKYLLGLELTDPGFDFSVLCEFRTRLLAGTAQAMLLDKLLQGCCSLGLIKPRGKQRTDSTHVLAAIRVMNRLELVGETFRATLNSIATVAPDWLRTVAPREWHDRYNRRVEQDRLPTGKEARAAYAQTVGEDGVYLLDAVKAPNTPPGLQQLAIIETLRQTWQRHYEWTTDQAGHTHVRVKPDKELARAAESIESPYDPEARYRTKRDTQWTGYRVHFTETCEPETVNLITHVVTTPATVHEVNCTADIHQALVKKQLPPKDHIVDAAYIDAHLLIQSRQDQAIALVGPPRTNPSWQAKLEGGYDLDQFSVDWERQQVRCPQGKLSSAWSEQVSPSGAPSVSVHFLSSDCGPCPSRGLCTRAARGGRHLKLLPQAQYEALKEAREHHASEEGKQEYARRAGIEGTLSQGVRAFGLRATRYWGESKTHLQHVATAAAINVDRIVNWLDDMPRAQTRISRFAALAA